MKNLLPYERQMILAEVYHYAWYNDDAYLELIAFIKKWESTGKPVFYNPLEDADKKIL